MGNRFRAVLLWTLAASMLPGGAVAATVVPWSGAGIVDAGPCSPTQTDPAACFLLTDAELFSVDGVPGYLHEFSGTLVPNPDPNAFPFPTYVGSGTFSLTRGADALLGTWTNTFFPAPPPSGCDAAMPFGDPDCWAAESFALFNYCVDGGAGIYAGLIGTGTARVDVVTGFPPGNVNPALGTTYTQSGEFVLRQVPEPAVLGLLTIGLLGCVVRSRARS